MKKTVFSIITTLAVIAVVAAGAEVLLRVIVPEQVAELHHFKKAEREQKWGDGLDMFKSADPELIYEIRPNHTKKLSGIVVGEYGVVGRDKVSVQKPEGKTRIMIIGDSVGSLALNGDAKEASLKHIFPEVLQTMLGPTYEVLNFTVNGYNARQTTRLLQIKGKQFKPDLVIWQWCMNDPIQCNLPKFFKKDYPDVYLLEYLENILTPSVYDKRQTFPEFPCYCGPLRGNVEIFRYWAWAYHRWSPAWKGVETALERVQDYETDTGTQVVMALFPIFPETGDWRHPFLMSLYNQIQTATGARGIAVIQLVEDFEKYEPTEMFFSHDIFHPTIKGHKVAANAIFDHIKGGAYGVGAR